MFVIKTSEVARVGYNSFIPETTSSIFLPNSRTGYSTTIFCSGISIAQLDGSSCTKSNSVFVTEINTFIGTRLLPSVKIYLSSTLEALSISSNSEISLP